MDFSSLVLMEKDKETGFITKELGSFEVNEGALYVRKLFVVDNIICVCLYEAVSYEYYLPLQLPGLLFFA